MCNQNLVSHRRAAAGSTHHSHGQVYLKKNRTKPYRVEDFVFKLVYIVTSIEKMDDMWMQQKSDLHKADRAYLDELPPEEFPVPFLLVADEVKRMFVEGVASGEVTREFIGSQGVCGMLWPPLDHHEENHTSLLGVPDPSYTTHRLPAQHTHTHTHSLTRPCYVMHISLTRAHTPGSARRRGGFV